MLPASKNNLLEKGKLLERVFFVSVWHVFVSNLVLFFAYCVFHGNLILDGCDDQTICTTDWVIQISLEFKKRLVYKKVNLKVTTLLIYLSCRSRKQFTNFICCNSNSVFLTCSILSAKTDPLVCVDVVFWKELSKGSFPLFPRVSFSRWWDFCPLICFIGWSEPRPAHYQKLFTVDNNFANESVIEKCIQVVHVLVVEKESVLVL